MKKLKFLAMRRISQKRLKGSITTYVFLMFGLTVILYMFGFTNMFTAYQATASSDTGNQNTNLSNPKFQQDSNPLGMLLNSIISFATKNIMLVVGGIAGLVFLGAMGYFIGGANFSVFYSYIIIIGFLAVMLNYFVFPIYKLDEQTRNIELAPGLSISVVLMLFLNLFFILSIVEYVRGAPI